MRAFGRSPGASTTPAKDQGVPIQALFVYGSLLESALLEETPIAELERPIRGAPAATIRGELYDLGAYPALVDGEQTIHGRLVVIPAVLLAQTDQFEHYESAAPHRSLFLRERVRAFADGAAHEAWVYRYNAIRDECGLCVGDVPDPAWLIQSGDWISHCAVRYGVRGARTGR